MPGFAAEITPPHVHINLQVTFTAGKLFTRTVGEPGAQGATVAGMHGALGDPAAFAAITAGLAGAVHIANGMMLAIGAKSMMVATGLLSPVTGGPFGTTMRELGAAPKVHVSIAPAARSGAPMPQR